MSVVTSRKLERMGDEALLSLRVRDLPVSIDGSVLSERVEKLHDELAWAGVRIRPHAWLSDEWFTPTDVPGIAVPFYLGHPRLVRLERRMMLEAEGAGARSCMQILRHEAGHCVRVAYALHRRASWRRVFGRASAPYPASYRPKPYSRAYVQHLDNYYAQAHPDEDFAETFAVWLTPGLNWRRRYRGWAALKKLEYVDGLMAELWSTRAAVRSRRRVSPVSRLSKTLREHYADRRRAYGVDQPDVYLRDLYRVFVSPAEETTGPRRASAFLRANRRRLVATVARWTNQYAYTVGSILNEMTERCDAGDLRVPLGADEGELRAEVASLLTVLTMNEVHAGGRRIRL